jgi:hypothetical protein
MVPAGSEADAEVQPAPDDALVPVRVPELVVVGDLGPNGEPARQVDVEAELRAGHQPVLHTFAIDTAEVGAEARAYEAEIRREVEAQDRAAGWP